MPAGNAPTSASPPGDGQSRQALVEELRRGSYAHPPGLKPSHAMRHCGGPTRKPNTVQGEEHLGERLSCGSDRRRGSHLSRTRHPRGIFVQVVKSDNLP